MAAFRRSAGFTSHDETHRWSIDRPEDFWPAVWRTCGVIGDPGDVAFEPGDGSMLGGRFFPRARVNVVENLLADRAGTGEEALVYLGEDGTRRSVRWDELRADVAALAAALRADGVSVGDRVAAWMPNVPETVVALLAAQSLGAVFTSTSPDFGVRAVVDRFGQTAPVVLFAADGYSYGGRQFSCTERLREIADSLPTVRRVVIIPHLAAADDTTGTRDFVAWNEYVDPHRDAALQCARFGFDHPGLVLYSSGTTGQPKCIVHRAAGVVLTHMKEQQLHCDVRPGDRILYFTTCGWMMWNWLTSVLASGATAVLYDGSPFHPARDHLFRLVEQERLTLLGVSAKFIDASRKAGLRPGAELELSSLRTMCSTGSPLNAQGFEWVYSSVSTDVHLASISGGTDLCGCFVGGDPTRPVYAGEIQGAVLGMAVDVWDERGGPTSDRAGELVCTRPFPSIPLGFWGDGSGRRLRAAYFERFPGVWAHGDVASWTPHGGMVILGRSDATLNAGGVRIGTAEIYNEVEALPAIAEAVAVAQDWDDDTRVVLFVRLTDGHELGDELVREIRECLRRNASPRHVPALVLPVQDIPRTRSGKLSELAVADVVNRRPVRNIEALANPEALDLFRDLPALQA